MTTSKRHVLIVEDDDDSAGSLREILELEGYEVSRVANGRQALFVLDGALRPSVIVLDMMMPIMDGLEFRREQLQRHAGVASIPVVGWSAYDHLRPADFDIVRKGGPTRDLLARIRDLAEKPHASHSRWSARRLSAVAAVIAGLAALVEALRSWWPRRR